jgi:hypothetical protein
VQPSCNNDQIGCACPAPSAHEGSSPWLDRIGIGVSVTCAVHCVAAALLAAAPAFAATAAPGLGESFEWAEGPLLWAALGIGAAALVPAYLREHGRLVPLVLFGLGAACLGTSRIEAIGDLEMPVTVVGVALVASAHVANLRLRHRHGHGPHSHAH